VVKVRFMKYILIGLVLLIGLGYGGAKAYIHFKVSDRVDSVIPMAAPYALLRYGGIGSTLSGELTVDDVTIQLNGYQDAISIGRLGINTPSFLDLLKLSKMSANPGGAQDEPPEYFGVIAENIRISASSDYYRDYYEETIKALAPPDIRQGGVQCVGKYGYSPRALKALGYEQLVMSMSMIMRQSDAYFNAEMNFDIVEMIDVDLDISMEGGVMEGAAMGDAYQPRLRSMQLKLTDKSLNQRVVKYCTELGLTAAQILRAHINALQYAGGNVGIEFDKYVIDPYKEYLSGKSVFIASAQPREPIYLTRIDRYKPNDVPALLNLEALAR
jgi:hypothetical protein